MTRTRLLLLLNPDSSSPATWFGSSQEAAPDAAVSTRKVAGMHSLSGNQQQGFWKASELFSGPRALNPAPFTWPAYLSILNPEAVLQGNAVPNPPCLVSGLGFFLSRKPRQLRRIGPCTHMASTEA